MFSQNLRRRHGSIFQFSSRSSARVIDPRDQDVGTRRHGPVACQEIADAPECAEERPLYNLRSRASDVAYILVQLREGGNVCAPVLARVQRSRARARRIPDRTGVV